MTYSPVPTVATGDTWTASQHNTYIRDNFAALHPYTARGDIAYRNNAGNIARLALGDVTKCLKSYGGDPAYMGAFGFHVYKDEYQYIEDNTITQVTFNTEDYDPYNLVSSNVFTVPTGWGGLWLIGAGGYFLGILTNDGGLREIKLTGANHPTSQSASFTQNAGGSRTHVNVMTIAYLVESATIIVQVKQESGHELALEFAQFWGCKLA